MINLPILFFEPLHFFEFPFNLVQSSLLSPYDTSEAFLQFMPVEPQQMLMKKPLCPF